MGLEERGALGGRSCWPGKVILKRGEGEKLGNLGNKQKAQNQRLPWRSIHLFDWINLDRLTLIFQGKYVNSYLGHRMWWCVINTVLVKTRASKISRYILKNCRYFTVLFRTEVEHLAMLMLQCKNGCNFFLLKLGKNKNATKDCSTNPLKRPKEQKSTIF